MNHAIALNLRQARSLPGAFAFRLEVDSRAGVRLVMPHPDHRGLRFASVATGEACGGGLWVLEATGFAALVLEPGASASYGWRVWPCDRADRRPWRWIADADGWCVDFPRLGSPFRAAYDFAVDRDFFDPGSHAKFEHLEHLAREAGAEVWLGRAESNPVAFTRRF